jgi:hypothetical protein
MLEINAVVIYQIKTHYLYYIMVYKGWQRSNFWPQKKIVEITEFKNFCNSHSIWNFFLPIESSLSLPRFWSIKL